MLHHDIKACCNIKGPMTNEETISFSNAVINDPLHGCQLQCYLGTKQEVVDSIYQVGDFVQISMDELRSSGNAHEMEIHDNIVSTIANFSLQIVFGISKICNECDNWNSSSEQLALCCPLICALYFLETLFLVWEKIDDQFCKLYLAFKEQSGS